MKSTGIVRRTDNLGRVVIPKEIRKTHSIGSEQKLEIYVENGTIIIRKQYDNCFLCNGNDGLIEYNDRLICLDCISQIYKINCNRDGDYVVQQAR